jgi:Mn-dependent DtxR family transcriptional regulator
MPPYKKLYASGEDYLETILVLQKKKGMVRSVDVARYMDVSKPSVCHAVAALRDGGFLTMDENYYLHLTDAGEKLPKPLMKSIAFLQRCLWQLASILLSPSGMPAGLSM